jgi:hypothetical protein
VTFCNIANANAAMRGTFMLLIDAYLMSVGAGPTLDYQDATAFLAEFERMIEGAQAAAAMTHQASGGCRHCRRCRGMTTGDSISIAPA